MISHRPVTNTNCTARHRQVPGRERDEHRDDAVDRSAEQVAAEPAGRGHRSTNAKRRFARFTNVERIEREHDEDREREQVRRHCRRAVADADRRDERELVVAHDRPEGAVLREVQVLVAERRDRDAERLRQDHEPQPLRRRQPERRGGFGLPAVHGLDRPAHDLGDVARGVDHEREQDREVLRAQPDAAGDDPAVEFRNVEGIARREPGDEHDGDAGRERPEHDVSVSAGSDQRSTGASERRASPRPLQVRCRRRAPTHCRPTRARRRRDSRSRRGRGVATRPRCAGTR